MTPPQNENGCNLVETLAPTDRIKWGISTSTGSTHIFWHSEWHGTFQLIGSELWFSVWKSYGCDLVGHYGVWRNEMLRGCGVAGMWVTTAPQTRHPLFLQSACHVGVGRHIWAGWSPTLHLSCLLLSHAHNIHFIHTHRRVVCVTTWGQCSSVANNFLYYDVSQGWLFIPTLAPPVLIHCFCLGGMFGVLYTNGSKFPPTSWMFYFSICCCRLFGTEYRV